MKIATQTNVDLDKKTKRPTVLEKILSTEFDVMVLCQSLTFAVLKVVYTIALPM